MAVPISLYYTLPVHWHSLFHYTILYWPTDSPYITLLLSNCPLAVPISLLSLYWPTDSHYCTLLISSRPMTVPISLFNSLMAHWQSNITLLNSTGTLACLISLFYSLLAHRHSLYHSTTLYWHTCSPYIIIQYSMGKSLYNTLDCSNQISK